MWVSWRSYTRFFYKQHFYKQYEAEIDKKKKKKQMLRKTLRRNFCNFKIIRFILHVMI